jgi:hypothetical protein
MPTKNSWTHYSAVKGPRTVAHKEDLWVKGMDLKKQSDVSSHRNREVFRSVRVKR